MDYKFKVKLPVTKVKSPITIKRGVVVINLPNRQKVTRVVKPNVVPAKSTITTPSTNKPVRSPQKFDAKPKRVINNNGNKKLTRRNEIDARTVLIQNTYSSRIKALLNSGSGKTLVMIACGPSVNEVDFSPLLNNANIDFMLINKPLQAVNSPKYWVFCDGSQHTRNVDYYNSYNGTIITTAGVVATKFNHIKLVAKKGTGWSNDMNDGMFIGRSSTYSFMQMAVWMGYSKIFIFGCDMSAVGGKLHHYGVNPDVAPEVRVTRFAFEAKSYEYASNHLTQEIRNRFYFCSSYNKYNFIDKFNRLDHKKAVEYILSI